MLITLMQESPTLLVGMTHWADASQALPGHHVLDLLTVAQTQTKPFSENLWGDVSGSFNRFVKSGQLWALLIGIVVGYVFRSFTSYG